MKISNHLITMKSVHSYQESHTKKESLTFWKSGEDQKTIESNGDKKINFDLIKSSLSKPDKINISQEGIDKPRNINKISKESSEIESMQANLNIKILVDFVERLTGKKLEIKNPEEIDTKEIEETAKEIEEAHTKTPEVPREPESSINLIYEYEERYEEHEKMDFSSSGVIITEDGREINFDVNLSMSRSFIEENNITIREGGEAKDPLVINFDGAGTQLSETTFNFDIDNDGKENQIRFVNSNSGFLALDKNGDSVINNGSELFGTETGNGFGELSVYDEDQNGWIDENDSIYNNLRIWKLDENGDKQLFSLGESNVGAIYLGHNNTPFSIKDDENNTLAEVRETGVFLKETGQVGTIQQIDFII